MLGTSLLWRSTVAFTYLKAKSAKCFCLYFRWSWSWSCYFGLGFGLKNLVLFTSLPLWTLNFTLAKIRNKSQYWSADLHFNVVQSDGDTCKKNSHPLYLTVVGLAKTTMVPSRTSKKLTIDKSVRFDTVIYQHWTDRQADRQTDRQNWQNNIALCMHCMLMCYKKN